MNVFISYAREYCSVADAVTLGLTQDGHNVFFDRDNLRPGYGYHTQIRETIAAADLFIFLVSPEAVEPSSFALAELGLARERWPDPSGHVLPVLVAQTQLAQLPPYLRAVTILEPHGDLVAELLARVAAMTKLQQPKRQRGTKSIVAAIGLTIAAGAIATLVRVAWPPSPRELCYLKVAIRSTSQSPIPQTMQLDVWYQGRMESFFFNNGSANIHVGPLTAEAQDWTIQLPAVGGMDLGQHILQGCLPSQRALHEGFELTVTPR